MANWTEEMREQKIQATSGVAEMALNPWPSGPSQAYQSTNISEVREFEVWLSWNLTGWQVWRLVGMQKSPGALPTVPADTRAHELCSRDPRMTQIPYQRNPERSSTLAVLG